jgi:hypothetical protein
MRARTKLLNLGLLFEVGLAILVVLIFAWMKSGWRW